jgi:uncharacterized protein YjbJ (UPF0337 family)
MSARHFQAFLKEIAGQLKQKYGQLADDDLIFAKGKEDELLGRQERRLAKSRQDVRREIKRI